MSKTQAPDPAPTWHEVSEFLRGRAPLEGVWFGEAHPTRTGMYWWRSLLPAAIPAPEGAQADRARFETYFAESRRSRGAGKRPTFEQFEDGTYKDDHTQRHWWTWQQARAALAAPKAEGALPPLPEPHWPRGYHGAVPSGGYTADQMHAYAHAALAAPAPQAPVALAQEQWPPTPSAYQGDQYIGYSRTDLLKYAQEVLTAHGIPAPQTKEPTNDR